MRIVALVFPLLVASQATAADEPAFTKFTSKEGSFTVLMPGEPELRKVEQTASNGMKFLSQRYRGRYQGGNFGAAYMDVPGAVKMSEEERSKLLEGDAPRIAAALKAEVRSEKKLTLGKYPGRQIEIESKGGMVMRLRSYLVGERVYSLIVTGKKEIADSKEADAFLDSLELTK
jgi:hypothetical protein